MGKYIKYYDTHSEYELEEDILDLPNVSWCKQEEDVHYNPEGYFILFYNDDEITGKIQIFFSSDNHEVSDDYSTFPTYNKKIGYYSTTDQRTFATYVIGNYFCAICNKIELDMFKGGVSNVSIIVKEDDEVIGDNYQYQINDTILTITPKEGKWKFGCFSRIFISFTYNNLEYCSVILIDNCT